MKGKMKEDIKETNQGKLRGNIKENQGEKSRKIKGKYQGEKSRKIKEENQGKSRENKYHSVKTVPAGLEEGPEEIGEHVDRELGGKHDGVKHFEPVQNILRPLQFIRAVVIRQ